MTNPTNTPSNNELDERSKERIEIEYLFVGHNFPNTEIVDRIQNWANKKVIDSLEKLSLEVIEPCEPDCDEVRHALREGSWNAHIKIEETIEALRKKGDV